MIMNTKYFKYAVLALTLGVTTTSCKDFLDRPDEDNPSMSNYYHNDMEVQNGVLSLYSSVWNDFVSRGYYKVGDVLSGNVYSGGSPYMTFTVNGSDEDIKSSSQSLWAANAHANTIYMYLKDATCSEAARNAAMGECLAWKAMAYFYLVRMFGNVPIVHDNTADVASNTYNDKPLVMKSDIYEYIVMTLEKAIELLPEQNGTGRIDKWGAKGLLAKVYLTKSGVNAGGDGERNAEDLAKAAELAKDVIKNSGKALMPNYADIFIGTKLAAFDVDPFTNPSQRINIDARRQASFMMAGDVYSYFWRDKTYNNEINGRGNGFDYLQFLYDDNYYCDDNYAGIKKQGLQSMSGANIAKHQYGNIKDHETMFGQTPSQQRSSMSTHVLRLADVYLVYAEAMIQGKDKTSSTSDADAIDAFYQVRHRSVPSYSKPASITLEDVLKERRLELAFEGDYWYDIVRLSYYNIAWAKEIIANQMRGYYNKPNESLPELYKNYWETKGASWTGTITPKSKMKDYITTNFTINVNDNMFTLPMPTEDAEYNPMLLQDPVHVDVRSTYSY